MSRRTEALFTRRTFLMATGALALAALSACTPDSSTQTPTALTADQAERLASFRLKNYLAEQVSYTVAGPETLPISGSVLIDTQAHTGQGLIATGDEPASLVVWGEKSVFTGVDPEKPDDLSTWSGRDLGDGDVDSFLRLLLLLASDRPENAQLLQQSGASWLGTETVNGVVCDVFTGPGADSQTAAPDPTQSPVRYMLDKDGVLQFFSARIAGTEETPWSATRTDTPPDAQIPPEVWQAMDQAAAAAAAASPSPSAS